MNPQHNPRARHAWRGLLLIAGLILLGGMAATWSWNSIAVGLFEAPRMRFMQGLALEVFLAASVSVCVCVLRFAQRRPGRTLD